MPAISFYRETEKAVKEAEKLVLCLINGNREEFNLEGSVRIEGDINQITQTRLVLGILADYSDRNNYDLYLLSERSGDSAVFKRKAFKELITGPDIIKRFDEEIKLTCFGEILRGVKEVEAYGYEKICRITRGSLQYQEEIAQTQPVQA